ncbi:MAG: hypothetical protein HXX15_15780 [Rhodopseudomonas sp.]|uniref:DUF6968 family protein n=1 Tax=Rhodopseudomonas sp. TaxID=1078 RepID=UPI001854BAED|nr:hypothetical protein [Rhodopseudomonas sp.]NVN87536.1 hypothetical protein [Rhodopseudomonas sp.]
MVIATRILRLRDDEASQIPVRIFAPAESDHCWQCYFEIGWPQGLQRKYAGGADAIEALEHAMRLIGTLLYSSDLHETGRLMWDQPGRGYGFPVPRGIRDLLIGDDARFL